MHVQHFHRAPNRTEVHAKVHAEVHVEVHVKVHAEVHAEVLRCSNPLLDVMNLLFS